MRIFVAGGTGVVGRRAVPAWAAAGHQVTALARSVESAQRLGAAGARVVEVSLFDPGRLAEAVRGSDVVVNLATSIPPFSKAALSSAWKQNDRLRREGSRNLVEAARASGADRYVQESIAFLYEDAGSTWITEDSPVRATRITASALDAEAEARRLHDAVAVVVLRFGAFYGPDSGHTLTALRMARRGFGTTPGRGDAYLSPVSTDDAAAAVVAVATAGSPGTYNVVDDEPVTREDFDRALARAVGRRRLRPMPALPVRLLGDKLDHVTRSQRVANTSLREATGWAPRYRSIREGLPVTVEAAGGPSHPTRRAR